MIADPPVRPDRRCANPGCSKPLVEITARHRRYGGDAVSFDPFCSTECCRAYHNTPYSQATNEPSADITVHSGRGVASRHGTRDGYRLCACEACTAAVKGAA